MAEGRARDGDLHSPSTWHLRGAQNGSADFLPLYFFFFFLSRYSMPDTISRRGDPLMSSLLISWSSQSSEEHARNKIRGKIQRMYNMVKSSGGKDEDGTQST